MDFNSRRINRDSGERAARRPGDARCDQLCLHRSQPAGGSATILAKQDCILAGIGCVGRILDVYAALDGAGGDIALRSDHASRDL